MTDSERIRKVVDYYDVSVNRFSKRLDINTPQILYDVLKGKNGLSKDLAEKITRKCNEINPGWLLTGEGEMLKQNNEPKQTEDGNIEYWKSLVDYLIKELEEKRRDYIELRDEVRELKTQLVMHNQESKKKELNPDDRA